MGKPGVREMRIWPTKSQGAQSPHIAGPSAQSLVHATRCALLTGVVTNLNLILSGGGVAHWLAGLYFLPWGMIVPARGWYLSIRL